MIVLTDKQCVLEHDYLTYVVGRRQRKPEQIGRTIAQAVSRRLSTAAARV
jgi:hypothetical protein